MCWWIRYILFLLLLSLLVIYIKVQKLDDLYLLQTVIKGYNELGLASESEAKDFEKYISGLYCEKPNVPDGTIIEFTSGESKVYVSDNVVVQTKGTEYIVYKVTLKKNNLNEDASVYTLEYLSDRSGSCTADKFTKCGETGDLCPMDKCIYYIIYILIVTKLEIEYKKDTESIGKITPNPSIQVSESKILSDTTNPSILLFLIYLYSIKWSIRYFKTIYRWNIL